MLQSRGLTWSAVTGLRLHPLRDLPKATLSVEEAGDMMHDMMLCSLASASLAWTRQEPHPPHPHPGLPPACFPTNPGSFTKCKSDHVIPCLKRFCGPKLRVARENTGGPIKTEFQINNGFLV